MWNSDNNNLLLNQIHRSDQYNFFVKELIPAFDNDNKNLKQLSRDANGNIFWMTLDLSVNILENNKFKNTNIYYDKGRIGIGRFPLFKYKVDIAIPKNTLMTAVHIGDGSFGFSLGNGATEGFIPEIIGIGSDENDAGLYFVGIAGNNKTSNIPLILFDGRNTYNNKLTNRPILGVTSGKYNEYKLLVDYNGNLTINDIILENKSLKETIIELKKEIEFIKTKIT
jgi:hypothetical protein